MIQLGLPSEPRWLDLPAGVRVRVLPMKTKVYETARNRARAEIEGLRTARAAIEAAGGDVLGMPNLDDVHVLNGETLARLVSALAQAAIIEWSGVVDEHGEVVAPSPERIAELMDFPRISGSFFDQYMEQMAERTTEKNG